jgi:hypothetical protein
MIIHSPTAAADPRKLCCLMIHAVCIIVVTVGCEAFCIIVNPLVGTAGWSRARRPSRLLRFLFPAPYPLRTVRRVLLCWVHFFIQIARRWAMFDAPLKAATYSCSSTPVPMRIGIAKVCAIIDSPDSLTTPRSRHAPSTDIAANHILII